MIDPKQNLIVIIPAYEPPEEFIPYAKEVASYAKRLVVVNDGSNERFNSVFEKIAEIENADYLTYGENHGKGYALKYAFDHCIKNFSADDIIVTADCDGQHTIPDVMKVFGVVSEHKDALVLGSRDFRESNVPKRSRFGNNFTRKLYKLLYGLKLYDTQTGLRGFTVGLAKSFVNVKGDRFEYELGQLIYAKKNGIDTFETPIATVYPENPEEHVSHFRTIRDSARVMGVMLSNLGYYFLSSVLSSIVDVGVFFLLSSIIFPGITWYYTLAATVSARVISSIVNFSFNYKYVFDGSDRRSLIRYYILWACQLGASYGIASVFSQIAMLSDIWLTLAKGLGDLCLALLSYQVQRVWVFKSRDGRRFWSPFIRFLKAMATLFSTEYRCNLIPKDEAVVYVARHLNMHGVFTTLKWIPYDIHPMVFNVFFKTKTCYNQYANYTFTERVGKKKKKFNIKAALASLAVPGLIGGIRGIPVYRDRNAIKTFKRSLECLTRGEDVIVYADVKYTASSDKESDIYDGFLYLGQYYNRKTGKSLKFVPLYIDEEKLSINEGEPISLDVFEEGRAEAKKYLQAAINGKTE